MSDTTLFKLKVNEGPTVEFAASHSIYMPLANPYVQRIPADIKPKTAGLTLDIPVGDTLTPYTITSAAQAIRLSLRTNDTRERKARKLKVSAFLETVWNASAAMSWCPSRWPTVCSSPRPCM
jgi:hypothetical protein